MSVATKPEQVKPCHAVAELLLQRCHHGHYLYTHATFTTGQELLRLECTDCTREERDALLAEVERLRGRLNRIGTLTQRS